MRSAKTGNVILNLLFVLLFMNAITLDLSLFVYFPKSFSHFSKRLLKVFRFIGGLLMSMVFVGGSFLTVPGSFLFLGDTGLLMFSPVQSSNWNGMSPRSS